ncbi:hypothetical protein BKA62DRAFT_671254 [Auriculariales sp. MPI-PUGE-AT-0066]|nr:hypothetical protein BKA62DRAFT_671254 [Auriculariales sp. MPI-PUGE-AT-0066]
MTVFRAASGNRGTKAEDRGTSRSRAGDKQPKPQPSQARLPTLEEGVCAPCVVHDKDVDVDDKSSTWNERCRGSSHAHAHGHACMQGTEMTTFTTALRRPVQARHPRNVQRDNRRAVCNKRSGVQPKGYDIDDNNVEVEHHTPRNDNKGKTQRREVSCTHNRFAELGQAVLTNKAEDPLGNQFSRQAGNRWRISRLERQGQETKEARMIGYLLVEEGSRVYAATFGADVVGEPGSSGIKEAAAAARHCKRATWRDGTADDGYAETAKNWEEKRRRSGPQVLQHGYIEGAQFTEGETWSFARDGFGGERQALAFAGSTQQNGEDGGDLRCESGWVALYDVSQRCGRRISRWQDGTDGHVQWGEDEGRAGGRWTRTRRLKAPRRDPQNREKHPTGARIYNVSGVGIVVVLDIARERRETIPTLAAGRESGVDLARHREDIGWLEHFRTQLQLKIQEHFKMDQVTAEDPSSEVGRSVVSDLSMLVQLPATCTFPIWSFGTVQVCYGAWRASASHGQRKHWPAV